MRRVTFALAIVLPLLTMSLPTPAEASGAGARAMWVWTRPAPKTLVSFALKQHVQDLFVAYEGDSSWLRQVVRQAHASGLRVQALGGDPGWIDDPAAAVAWEQSALATALFDGIHVDVEPWVRVDWETDQSTVVAGYLDVLRRLAAASSLPVEADVAFWLYGVPTADGTPLDQAVFGVVDRATVMSYRNAATGPDSITDIGAHELATAATAGIPCRLAVETNDLGADPVSRKQTFYGMRATALSSALAAVDRAEAGSASFAGVAVEDYAGWRALK